MRITIKLLTIIAIAFVIFTGCEQKAKKSPLLNESITKDNLVQIITEAGKDPLLTADEMKYLSTGMTTLLSKSVDSLVGKTLAQVIEFEIENERNQMAANLANVATRSELVLNHKFLLVGLAPQADTANNRELNSIVFEFTNRSDKDIVDFKGALQIYTQNRQLVKNFIMGKIPVVLGNQPIKAGETRRIIYPFVHDPNNNNDMTLRTQWDQMRRIWVPSEIIFADGTKISVANTLSENVNAQPNP